MGCDCTACQIGLAMSFARVVGASMEVKTEAGPRAKPARKSTGVH